MRVDQCSPLVSVRSFPIYHPIAGRTSITSRHELFLCDEAIVEPLPGLQAVPGYQRAKMATKLPALRERNASKWRHRFYDAFTSAGNNARWDISLAMLSHPVACLWQSCLHVMCSWWWGTWVGGHGWVPLKHVWSRAWGECRGSLTLSIYIYILLLLLLVLVIIIKNKVNLYWACPPIKG